QKCERSEPKENCKSLQKFGEDHRHKTSLDNATGTSDVADPPDMVANSILVRIRHVLGQTGHRWATASREIDLRLSKPRSSSYRRLRGGSVYDARAYRFTVTLT